MKEYRIYNVVLTDIRNIEDDYKFSKFIEDKRLNWWRYSPLCWILVTPITVSTNDVLLKAVEAYGPEDIIFVFEIDINDFAGILPKVNPWKNSKLTPFNFFNDLRDSKMKFNWLD
ncbi:hypothetical protein MYRA21_0060 [Myroides sp. A21]|uniref:hypothetical protein n=1 Tax=Myroides sp. A21 TaxID=1583100 RepID=UPI00058620A4|nr:hypothetical protein [Myroides sp. A21]AJA67304.1 hypothetical protein MYRA21_0060 [Myroides sp. A21]